MSPQPRSRTPSHNIYSSPEDLPKEIQQHIVGYIGHVPEPVAKRLLPDAKRLATPKVVPDVIKYKHKPHDRYGDWYHAPLWPKGLTWEGAESDEEGEYEKGKKVGAQRMLESSKGPGGR